MSATEVKYLLKRPVLVSLLEVMRNTPANIPGGARRLEVSEQIVALDKQIPDEIRSDRSALQKVVKELVVNREHLGAIKLAMLDLWSSKVATGMAQEQIAEVARELRIWKKHIIPALPKDEIPAIVDLDDEADMADLDDEAEEQEK